MVKENRCRKCGMPLIRGVKSIAGHRCQGNSLLSEAVQASVDLKKLKPCPRNKKPKGYA